MVGWGIWVGWRLLDVFFVLGRRCLGREWSLSGEIDITQCFLIRVARVFISYSLAVLFFLFHYIMCITSLGVFLFLFESFVASFITPPLL